MSGRTASVKAMAADEVDFVLMVLAEDVVFEDRSARALDRIEGV